MPVERVPFGLRDERFRVRPDQVRQRPVVRPVIFGVEIAAQIVAGEAQGPAGVLLLDVAVEVGGVADLRLHFLLAVAEVVVGDERDDDPAREGDAAQCKHQQQAQRKIPHG